MRTLLGTEGGDERVILCVAWFGVYLAVRPWRRYYRAGFFVGMLPWCVRGIVGRS